MSKWTSFKKNQLIVENWRKYLNEVYVIPSKDPIRIKDVIANWVEGERAGEEKGAHATYPIDELLEYRDFSTPLEASLEEMEKFRKDIKEVGVTEPIIMHVGKNGQASIEHGNKLLEFAKQLNIKELPVKFIFKDFVKKAGKVTEEPAVLMKNLEDQEENPLQQSMPGMDSSLSVS